MSNFVNLSSEEKEYLLNLPYHLWKGNMADELHQLLAEAEESRNWWYQFLEWQDKTTDYLTDVNYAWQLADKAFDSSPSQAVGLQCRYALIAASLNSLAASIPVKLIATLVEKHFWSPAQALTYIQHDTQQVQEENKLTEILKELAPHLVASVLPDALEVVQGIVDEHYREEALTGLATGLTPNLVASLFPAALEVAREIQDEGSRANALVGLAPYLPSSLLSDALEVVRGIVYEHYREEALTELASGLAPRVFKSG